MATPRLNVERSGHAHKPTTFLETYTPDRSMLVIPRLPNEIVGHAIPGLPTASRSAHQAACDQVLRWLCHRQCSGNWKVGAHAHAVFVLDVRQPSEALQRADAPRTPGCAVRLLVLRDSRTGSYPTRSRVAKMLSKVPLGVTSTIPTTLNVRPTGILGKMLCGQKVAILRSGLSQLVRWAGHAESHVVQ